MMAYQRRVNQFRSRIDFDDPSTTKPQSLAKSAVLQALEEEEREQSRAGKGWQRPSRSRQRDAPAAVPRTRTPCINRDTVMRINRHPVRHRSCDNFWPPARTPSPLDRMGPSVGETEGGSFAYEGARRYGSHESVYFDERVRKQHKIDPLRTKFDKANVVLVDWGRKGGTGQGTTDNGAFDKRGWEKVDDIANNSIKRGENIESEKRPSQPLAMKPADTKRETKDEDVVFGWEDPKPKPPSPPPRRYFLPLEQLQPGVGVEILLRCYKVSPNQEQLQDDPIQSKIDNYPDSHRQSAPGPSSDGDSILHRDGIQSKPPLKTRSTPTRRTNLSSKPPTPVHFTSSNHSHGVHDTPTTQLRDEFNINSDTILNLNIDTGFSPNPMAPQITVTECHRDQTPNTTANQFDKRHPEQQTVPPKTSDQLLNEIIDENHNYNEKLITNSGRCDAGSPPSGSSNKSEIGCQCLSGELPNEQHSKLNVSNQPNRNWINLNSNEIYPLAGGTSEAPLWWDRPAGGDRSRDPSSVLATAAARMTQTRVRSDSLGSTSTAGTGGTVSRPPEETNDGHRAASHVDIGASNSSDDAHNNYDNKSVKSNYWDPMRATAELSSSQDQQQQRLRRSESRDSETRSWRVDEVLEFPPPPPYLCLCEEGTVPSGRCSAEGSAFLEDLDGGGAQICDNRNPTANTNARAQQRQNTPCKVDNPTISQSCRQDSTSTVPSPSSGADVSPTFQRWHDNRAAATRDTGHHHQQLRRCTDDYFKTNLTDDKFLNENVNIACKSSDGQQQLRGKLRGDITVTVDPRGTNDDSLPVDRSHRAAPSGVQNFDPLHKSNDAFLAAERQASPKCTTGDPPAPSPSPPPPPPESKNSVRYISFTDGEFIFGPYDARSEEFQRFDLWGGDFHKRQNCCCHRPCKKRSPSGTSDGSSSTTSTLCLECHDCRQRRSETSSETLKEVDELAESETFKSPQQQKTNQVENYDDTPRNVPAGNESPQRPTSISYGRWVRFENGNISPPPPKPQPPSATSGHHRSPTPRVPTPYPSPTGDGELGDKNHHQDIFDQFAAAIEHQPQSKPDLVENVPLIDAVLDDLLTFSKTLVLRQSPTTTRTTSCAEDFPLATVREEAKIVEINDDNLINLLADDDDNSGTKVVGETQNRHSGLGGANADALGGKKSLPSKHPDDIGADAASSSAKRREENSGNESFREEKCALNTNEDREQLESDGRHRSVDDSKDVIDNYLSTRRNQEDIFANVAIFSWNPLDVYHQHGLFMIDPRFALADLRATTPEDTTHGQDDSSYSERGPARTFSGSRKRNDAHLNSPKLCNDRHLRTVVAQAAAEVQVADDDTGGHAETGIGITGITDGADPSSVDVNSFATQLALGLGDTATIGNDDDDDGDGCLLESHKIPNDRASPAMDHFYDSAHVEYPVRADLCTIIQECHQSPKESDYDNDPAKNTTTRTMTTPSGSRRGSLQRAETEGLKRVAWPPPAELGDDYQHQQPAQQQQQPYHYPPQQQQQQQQQPTHQQSQQFYPQQQQHYQQPQTQQHQPRERIIPIQRPEPSTQQPQYQPQPTQAFQPLVSQHQQQQQQQFYQPPEAIPQHHQQPQQQQQPASVADSQIPFFTTLRKEAPMSQEPAPVYHTEPVAAIYQGGTNMRGDQKWPPADVKKQSELENEERRQLAQQPAFRPRKVQKDYADFFAKNALNATYPGYRAPPGTQHHS